MPRVVAMRTDSDDRVDTFEFTDEAETGVRENGRVYLVNDPTNEGSKEAPKSLALTMSHYRAVFVVTK